VNGWISARNLRPRVPHSSWSSGIMREEIKALKRKRIIEEAAELFSEKGYSVTTLDDVARQLKVTKPFIYAHFSSKSDLLSATFVRIVELCLIAANEALASDETPTRKLCRLTRDIVRIAAENRVYSAIFLREQKHVDPQTLAKVNAMENQWHRKLERLLREGNRAGEFDVADVPLTALIIGGQIAWIYAVRESVAERDVTAVQDTIEEMVLRMVGARSSRPGRGKK